MRDDWFHLETQRQAFDAAEAVDDGGWVLPTADRGDPGFVIGIALTVVAAAMIVLAQSVIF